MNRVVSNEEFEAALTQAENQYIMEAAARYFRQKIDFDEIHRCKLMALWDALRTWRPCGRKFTSFLYQKVQWECIKVLKEESSVKHHTILGDVPFYPQNVSISDLLDILSPDLKDMVQKRYLERMTLREIGSIYGCCKETIRRKINRAIKILQNTHIKQKMEYNR